MQTITGLYSDGKVNYKQNYLYKKRHGLQKGWYYNGQLQYIYGIM